jgi:hypothetical protein
MFVSVHTFADLIKSLCATSVLCQYKIFDEWPIELCY